MSVVAHHPVVVHLEGVAVDRLSVDVDLVAFHLQVVKFIGMDDALIERQVFQRKLYGLAFLGNLDGTIVVDTPRIEVWTVGINIGSCVVFINTFYRSESAVLPLTLRSVSFRRR